MDEELENRRPLKSRGTAWAQACAAAVARMGVTPDGVSAASMGFAAIGAALLVYGLPLDVAPRAAALVGAIACIQLRLVCNLLDGMVAVEYGKGGPLGPIWNEVPDRIADVAFLAAAGYGAAACGVPHAVELGWAAAMGAVLTAYVRELGRGLGFPADFAGPMAKPHRMFTLSMLCVLSAVEPLMGGRGHVMAAGLGLIALGTVITTYRRLSHLAAGLRARQAAP